MELIRSLLFVPGNRQNMIEKARAVPADALVLDLEDSVPLAEKMAARDVVRQALPTLAQRGQMACVRVNSLSTGLFEGDIAAVAMPELAGISVGKVESAADVRVIDTLIEAIEKRRGLKARSIRLLPWIETAKGIINAFEIASASPRILGVSFGAEDYTADMEIERTKEGMELFYARSAIGVAARAAGVLALDTPNPDFRDLDALERDSRTARQMGYRAKWAIHPAQIEVIHRVFTPSEEEVAYARRVVEVFAEAEAQGRASTSLDGKMIDIPVAVRARKLLQLADAIAARQGT